MEPLPVWSVLLVTLYHLFTIILTASLPTLNISTAALPSLISASSNISLTPSSNITDNWLYPIPDPYNRRYPRLHQTLEYYDYREPLPKASVDSALHRAFKKCVTKNPKAIIDVSPLEFWSGDVQVLFYPREQVDWRMWSFALWAIGKFVGEEPFYYGFSFIVLQDALGDVGYGVVVNGTKGG
ncbi:hypothetical protein MMC28_007197 [Mycoblastus sanguinarius]|nr:hypothetical protein [Mycoblastus sanguinarius]